MKDARIIVKVFYVNGNDQTVLSGDTPKNAIENYFFPDAGMKTDVSILIMNTDGKSLTLNINGTTNTVSWKEH